MDFCIAKNELNDKGFFVLENIYSEDEVNEIIDIIDNAEYNDKFLLNNKNLFAIRQILKVIPKLKAKIFNKNLLGLISKLSEYNLFLTKSIYFDKPSDSNWFVSYHQDLSISVNDKNPEIKEFINWTFKNGQFGVQPPIKILEDTITVRIHLDKTELENGALKVIQKSHLGGIIRVDTKSWNLNDEVVCEVDKGGVMLMKPLILHASNRTLNGKRRRVIHLEFNRHQLPQKLEWLEYYNFNNNNINFSKF